MFMIIGLSRLIGQRCNNGRNKLATLSLRHHRPHQSCAQRQMRTWNLSSQLLPIKFIPRRNLFETFYRNRLIALSCVTISGGKLESKPSPTNQSANKETKKILNRLEPSTQFVVHDDDGGKASKSGDDDEICVKKKLYPQFNRIYTLPNVLCMFRIGITPLIGYLIVAHQFELALALCAASSLTDFFDGWIARTFNSESKLGAVLDPLADKLLVATLTFALTYVHIIPLWLTALILTRDSLIIAGGLYIRARALSPPRTFSKMFDIDTFRSDRFQPTAISKINTGFQLSLVLVSCAAPIFPAFFTANAWFLPALQASTGVTTLWSGLNYLTRLK